MSYRLPAPINATDGFQWSSMAHWFTKGVRILRSWSAAQVIHCHRDLEMTLHCFEQISCPRLVPCNLSSGSSQRKSIGKPGDHWPVWDYNPCVVCWTALPIHLHISYSITALLLLYEVRLVCNSCKGTLWVFNLLWESMASCTCDHGTWNTVLAYSGCSADFQGT